MNTKTLLSLVALVIVLAGGAYMVLSPRAEQAMDARLAEYETTTAADMPIVDPNGGVESAAQPTTETSGASSATAEDGEVTKTPTTPTVKATPTTPAPTTPAPAPSGYTMAEVAAHASKASCWTAVNGSVYDITAYIPRHPGGEKAALQVCGIDGTALFEGQHGGDMKPETMLAKLRIGALVQ